MIGEDIAVRQKKIIGPLRAKIAAVAAYLSTRTVTNAEIASRLGEAISPATMEKIFGVRERRVAQKGWTDSDLSAAAATRCLEKAGVQANDLSKLPVTRLMGDRLLPMTAAFVQNKIGCSTAVQAYDVNGSSHSFLQAFQAGACAVESDDGPVLIVSRGIVNPIVSQTDPRTAFCMVMLRRRFF